MASEIADTKKNLFVVIGTFPLRLIRFLVALLICLVAVILPYKLRLYWYQWVAQFVHLPFRAFGALARFIMTKTNTENPFED